MKRVTVLHTIETKYELTRPALNNIMGEEALSMFTQGPELESQPLTSNLYNYIQCNNLLIFEGEDEARKLILRILEAHSEKYRPYSLAERAGRINLSLSKSPLI